MMKRLFILLALAALMTGCGASNRAVQNDDQVEVGYGSQSKRNMTTAVSNVKVKKSDSQT